MNISNKVRNYVNPYKVDPDTQRVYRDRTGEGQYKPDDQVLLTKNDKSYTPITASELKSKLQAAGGSIDLSKTDELRFGRAELDLTEEKPEVKDGVFNFPYPKVYVDAINQYTGGTSDMNLFGVHYLKTSTPTSTLLQESPNGGFQVDSEWNVAGKLSLKGLPDPFSR